MRSGNKFDFGAFEFYLAKSQANAIEIDTRYSQQFMSTRRENNRSNLTTTQQQQQWNDVKEEANNSLIK